MTIKREHFFFSASKKKPKQTVMKCHYVSVTNCFDLNCNSLFNHCKNDCNSYYSSHKFAVMYIGKMCTSIVWISQEATANLARITISHLLLPLWLRFNQRTKLYQFSMKLLHESVFLFSCIKGRRE